MAKTKTYSDEEMTALVAEFSREFDVLVKGEVTKAGQALRKDEDDGDGPDKKGPPSEGSESSDSVPPDASASAPPAPPAADPASASAPPADPASAGAPPADPASAGDPATGGDPVEALKQAYASLPPEELQMHFLALKDVLQAQMAASAPAAGAPGLPGAPAPAAPAPAPMAPPAAAPLAAEGSQPVDPAATMALKSEFDKQLSLVKSERDAQTAKVTQLEKSLEALTESMGKVLAQPVRKSITGKDLIEETLGKTESKNVSDLSKSEITKKLLAKSRDPKLEKKDRELISNYYRGSVNAEALSHLLG